MLLKPLFAVVDDGPLAHQTRFSPADCAPQFLMLPPSAFFIIGCFIWILRTVKARQRERVDFKIIDAQIGEHG